MVGMATRTISRQATRQFRGRQRRARFTLGQAGPGRDGIAERDWLIARPR